MLLPWLPAGHTAILEGRGEVFYRHHQHADATRPTVLLLHGWTASGDLQFFTAYEALAEYCSFVAIDHRGHGRGLRGFDDFELHDAADDAAALVEHLGLTSVIVVGYSMGGPISLLLTQRHPDLVGGIVVQATALEWRATVGERVRWKTVRLLGPILRSWAFPSWLRVGMAKMAKEQPLIEPYIPWFAGEMSRNSAGHIVSAGRALSRYNATAWAGSLNKPAGMLITTKDRLVKPGKQRELAAALDAFVVELPGDHIAPLMQPQEFAQMTVQLVQHVAGRLVLAGERLS
jgi:3-oxoadipate enol-lactonase